MNAITIDGLIKMLKAESDKGHGDYVVFVTDDEEGNGYHALWYEGETPAEMDEEQREYVEELNHDLSLVGPGEDSKAYYVG